MKKYHIVLAKQSASDLIIDCCPICASEEFLLADDASLLICIECGPIPLNGKLGAIHLAKLCTPAPYFIQHSVH